MEKIILKIDGMHCSMCEAHVCDAIRKALPSAKSVKANHHQGEASFVVPDGEETKGVEEALNGLGYRVEGQSKAEAKHTIFGWR